MRILSKFSIPQHLRASTHALGATQIIGWGTTMYAPAILATPIVADTGWARTDVFAAFSASLVIGALLARPAGRLIDRHGGRAALAAGSGLTALGLALAAIAPTLPLYFAAWAVLGVAMRLMLYEAAFATLAAAGGNDARRAISVLTLYGGLASTVFWLIGWELIAAFGWRATFAVYAALNLCVCLPLHAFFLPASGPAGPAAERDATASENRAGVLVGRERKIALVTLTIAFVLLMYVNSALSAHLIDILIAFGLSSENAVAVASLKGIGQVAGRIWEIVFAGAFHPLTLSTIAIGLTPLALATLLLPLGIAGAILFTFGQGASNGLVTIARGVAPLVLFGSAGYGTLIGAMAAPVLMAVALAPAAYAALVERYGPPIAMLTNIAAALIGFVMVALLAWWARKPSRA
ncbi:MAG: MFS transporter [Pseudomonadota bacterium]